MHRKKYRLGVDIGGTFTDFVLVGIGEEKSYTHKQLTTPEDPAQSVLTGAAALLESKGVKFEELEAVIHGTTLVTNAVIERRGCKVGMIVTKGFADILDIGREQRYDLFDLRLTFPAPFVDRRRRQEVDERTHFDGAVSKVIDESKVLSVLKRLVDEEDCEAIAVCLLHSYKNPSNEQAVRKIIEKACPDVYVSLSSEGYPVIREYERWTTTAANAYVQPLVDSYLAGLETGLNKLGFDGNLLIMSSSGGTLTPETARRFPVRLLESGPAAGALMSGRHGERVNHRDILSFDMGGTTAKGAIIVDGKPLKGYELEAGRVHGFKKGSGLKLSAPVIDMIEIGTGGGSIAQIDTRGLIQVGPRSAGADPGPACYGLGNKLPTLTDANLILGYLDSSFFLGGKMVIRKEYAEKAIDHHISQPLQISLSKAAWGIHELANEEVSKAFRVHASERGIDYRRCAMVAFGGSGPLHAVRIAKKLRIPRVIIPPAAGVMSAFGMLASPLSIDLVKSERVAMSDLCPQKFDRVFADLEDQASEILSDAGVAWSDIVFDRIIDMRYIGQGYEVEVRLADRNTMSSSEIRSLFDKKYASIFGITLDAREVEIVTWKIEATAAMTNETIIDGPPDDYVSGVNSRKGTRKIFDPTTDQYIEADIYNRYLLPVGAELIGPALIEETESTTVITSGEVFRIDRWYNIVIDVGE